MSYPSITSILKERRLSVDTASEAQLENALIEAFNRDLPLGMTQVEQLVKKCRENDGRAMLDAETQSDTGKQYMRLLGPDVPRRALEKHFGVSFAFYNCCKGVAAPKPEQLQISAREQIMAQDPQFVDC